MHINNMNRPGAVEAEGSRWCKIGSRWSPRSSCAPARASVRQPRPPQPFGRSAGRMLVRSWAEYKVRYRFSRFTSTQSARYRALAAPTQSMCSSSLTASRSTDRGPDLSRVISAQILRARQHFGSPAHRLSLASTGVHCAAACQPDDGTSHEPVAHTSSERLHLVAPVVVTVPVDGVPGAPSDCRFA